MKRIAAVLCLVLLAGPVAGALAIENAAVTQMIQIGHTNVTHPNHRIEEMVTGPDGSFWFISRGGGLIRRSAAGEWTHFTTNLLRGIHNNFPRNVAFGPDGTRYVGYSDGLVVHRPDGTWTRLRAHSSALLDDEITALLTDEAGGVWVGQRWYGASYWAPDGTWTNYRIQNSGIASNWVRSMHHDGKGGVWFVLQDSFHVNQFGGVSHRDAQGTWTHYRRTTSGISTDQVRDFLVAPDGTVWLCGPNGISRFRDGKWYTYTRLNSALEVDDVRGLTRDSSGNIWAATFGSGLAKIDPSGSLRVYKRPVINIPNNDLLDVKVDPQGDLWVVSEMGLTRFAMGEAAPVPPVTPADPGGIRVFVDGRAMSLDVAPVMRDARVLVPMRALFEALGREVDWDPADGTIRVRGPEEIVLTVGSRRALVNGVEETLDVPAQVVSGRTLVPVRWVGERLDRIVVWDSANQRVDLVPR